MKINSIQNGPKQVSNKTAKAGAAVGLVASATYLAKNYDDIFAKSIRNVKSITVDQIKEAYPDLVKQVAPEEILAKIVKNTKIATVAIPVAAATAVVAGTALLGKVAGVIVDKINAKKAEKDVNIDTNQAKLAESNSNISFKGEKTKQNVYLDKPNHSLEYIGFDKTEEDLYASQRNVRAKKDNDYIINAKETKYIDGMPEEANFPLFVADDDCEMAYMDYKKLAEQKAAYGNAFDVHCENNAEVAD